MSATLLPLPASAWTRRRSAVVLPANMGPTMTWISPDWAARTSIDAPSTPRDWAADADRAAPSVEPERPRCKGSEKTGGREGKALERRKAGAAARRDLMAQTERMLAGFVGRTGSRRGANTLLFKKK
uniref:Uncharacterized protein n=1 Tax=Arundo donax TaxID=35708 RepID=A0A0A9EVB8_ARUDO